MRILDFHVYKSELTSFIIIITIINSSVFNLVYLCIDIQYDHAILLNIVTNRVRILLFIVPIFYLWNYFIILIYLSI